MTLNTDLHIHTYYSDGALSPKELVTLAKKRGLKNIAKTDHNTVKGNDIAVKEGKKIGINVIPGIEIATVKKAEILGYYVKPNKTLQKELDRYNKIKQKRIKDYCKLFTKNGYPIKYEELETRFPHSKDNYHSPNIFTLMYEKGYGNIDDMVNELFKKKRIKSKSPRPKLPITKAIKLIVQSGGVPVWAHPLYGETDKNFDNIEKFIDAGLKGIEINWGDRCPPKLKTRIIKTAKKYNLILTKGTDYHGGIYSDQTFAKTHELGKVKCDDSVVEELKQQIPI